MKIIITPSEKRLVLFVTCIFLVLIMAINILGYFLDMENISIIAAANQVDKYRVRNKLLLDTMERVGVCNPEAVANLWAGGLKRRSAADQYASLNSVLRKEYAKQLEESAPNWVTGVSSPWIESYSISSSEKIDNDNYIFKLQFKTQSSTGPAGDYEATLKVTREGDFWRISDIKADEGLYVYTGFKI